MPLRNTTSAILATLILTLPVSAATAPDTGESARELILKNPARAAGHYHAYEIFADTTMTSAPKGYVPFYISHYGRHGSRQHTGNKYMLRALPAFEKADSVHALTAEGKTVLQSLKAYLEEWEGLDGILTQKGVVQHSQIAARMERRFGEVFSSPDRKYVRAVSSVKLRCVQSMASFCASLSSESAPGLYFSFETGDRYMKYIARHGENFSANNSSKYGKILRDSLLNCSDFSHLRKTLFSDSVFASEVDVKVFYNLYRSASIRENLDVELPDMFKFFSPDELYRMWYIDNARIFLLMGESFEFGPSYLPVGAPLLKDIVEKADAALSDTSGVAADLRFGHDSAIVPLMMTMKLERCADTLHIADSSEKWYSFRETPMATNIQLVFYKNKKGEVLVKILHNECETAIRNLKPFRGPYYKWADLRAWFVKQYSRL